jgi:hypothetical protein
MQALQHPVVQAWLIASLIRAVCLIVLIWSGRARRYWGLTGFFAVGTARSAALFVAMLAFDKYYEVWLWTKPIEMALPGLLVVHGIILMVEHYKMPASFALLIGSIFATLSGISAATVAGRWIGLWLAPVAQVWAIWTRQEVLTLAFTLAAMFGFLSLFKLVKMRPNVRRFALITIAYLAANAGALAWITASGPGRQRPAQIALQVVAGCACMAWVLGLRKDGELWIPPRLTLEEAAATEDAERRITKAIRGAI